MKHFIILISVFFLSSCISLRHNLGRTASKFCFEAAENKIDDKIKNTYKSKILPADFTDERMRGYTDQELDGILDMLGHFKELNYIVWREKTLTEKSRRMLDNNSRTTPDWYANNIQKAYLSKGLIEQAYILQNKYHTSELSELPEQVIIEKSSGKQGWRIFDISDDGKAAIIKDSRLWTGKHIVLSVSWGCEFADAAIETILQNKELKSLFLEFGTILGTTFNLKEQVSWKKQTGMKRVYTRYSDNEIKVLSKLDSPGFYFIQDGAVKHEFDGVFLDEENLGLSKRIKEGIKKFENDNKIDKTDDKINIESTETTNLRNSPFILTYSDFLYKARDWQVLQMINNTILVKGCIISESVSGIAENNSKKEKNKILNDMDFCIKKTEDTSENTRLYNLLKDVRPGHKIEFARSIVTRDGHIISAYAGGIQKDLGRKKAMEIAERLTGTKPEYNTACAVSTDGNGRKTIKPVPRRGWFCAVE